MNLFGVGPTEILVVLVVVLILFGPDRLPEIAKRIGGASRELKNNLDTINDQMNEVLESSMELDKARMTPPAETPAPSDAPASPPQLTEPEPTNSILPPARTQETLPASTATNDAPANGTTSSAPAPQAPTAPESEQNT